jgi:hypothetical protein
MKNLKNKVSRFIFMLVLLFTLLLTPSFSATQTHALGLTQYFGGPVVTSFYCSCSDTWLLTIGPPTPALLVYANTPQYKYYQLPRFGVWTLGAYIPQVGVCYVYVVFGCAKIPSQGLITPTVGTSL